MISTDALRSLFIADIAATTGGDDHYTTQATLSLPAFAKEPLPVKFFADDIGWDDFLPALSATTALRDIAKTAAQEGLFANFLMICDALSLDFPTQEAVLANEGAGREFDDLRVPKGPDDIWRLVRFRHIAIDYSWDKSAINIILCADVAWDQEHEIGVFVRDGIEVIGADDPSTGL